MGIRIRQRDHRMLTVADVDAAVDFYRRVLGMQEVVFGDPPRRALAFGTQKINPNPPATRFEPKAERPTPDARLGGPVLHCRYVAGFGHQRPGPRGHGAGRRAGARHPPHSVYIRDPDTKPIEISDPLEEPAA